MRGSLVIGIDHYPAGNLTECAADAQRIGGLMNRNFDGSLNFESVVLTSKAAGSPVLTADFLRERVRQLVLSEATVIYIHFSGHADIQDGEISLLGQDDSRLRLQTVLSMIAEHRKRSSVLTLDCCFSGSAGRSLLVRGNQSVVPDRTAIISSSRKDEVSWERRFNQGQFSRVLCEGLSGGAADVLGNVTVASLYSYLDESFGLMNQRPTFTANLTTLVELRKCEPRLSLEVLRMLPTLFSSDDAELVLGPGHEETSGSAVLEKVEEFRYLQQCVAANLVEPVGSSHMYYAAIERKSCRLTPLGRRYWNLVNANRV